MVEIHTGRLEISTQSLLANYHALKARLPHTACGAVVKANAYGFGADIISPLLAEQGCQNFFVAHLEEALALRTCLPHQNIYVFSGLLPKTESLFLEHGLIPVLNDFGMLKTWSNTATQQNKKLPCVLHIDTGMRRNGFDAEDVEKLLNAPEILQSLDIKFVMSHLASASNQESLFNAQQKRDFDTFLKYFPGIHASLADTAGIYLPEGYHYDVARPGKGIVGLFSPPEGMPRLHPCLKLKAQIIQVRRAKKGDSVGYDGLHTLTRDSKLATLGIGFADGYDRGFSNQAQVDVQGHLAPVAGNISMDYTVIDVTDVPESLYGVGSWVELVNETLTLERLAQTINTISRELSTGFGSRIKRVYLEASISYENTTPYIPSRRQSL